jgi:hypothetical protein
LAPVIFAAAVMTPAALDAAIGKIGQAVGPPPVKSRAAIDQAVMPFFIFAQRDNRGPGCSLAVLHDALPMP